MTNIQSFLVLALLFSACKKERNISIDLQAHQLSIAPISSKSGIGAGGGGSTTAGIISSIGGAYRLIGGNSDSIQVNLMQPAPAAGYNMILSSSDPAVQLPSAFFVPAGELYPHPHLTSSVIPSSKNVTLSASINGTSKSFVLKVFPLHYNFPAPQLQSPGNGTGVKNRIQLKFTWSDNVNAYYHHIQIADNTSFINPILEVYLNDPIWAASYFNGLGKRYWRVRYIDASGTPGAWSETRNFEVKP